MSRPLSSCRQGDDVVIQKINAPAAIRKRLLEMGFMRNVPATIVKYAPLRDPIELRLKGFHVSLRVSEAELIEVDDGPF